MLSLWWLIDTIVNIAIWLLVANAVLSWLVAFNVVNPRHPFVNAIGSFLYRISEPVLRPIRRLVPAFGGIDISAVILILLLIFARMLLREIVVGF